MRTTLAINVLNNEMIPLLFSYPVLVTYLIDFFCKKSCGYQTCIRASTMELFCGNSQRLKAGNLFHKKSPSQMFGWDLNTPIGYLNISNYALLFSLTQAIFKVLPLGINFCRKRFLQKQFLQACIKSAKLSSVKVVGKYGIVKTQLTSKVEKFK